MDRGRIHAPGVLGAQVGRCRGEGVRRFEESEAWQNVKGNNSVIPEQRIAADEAAKHLEPDWTIEVCDACLSVACWHGEFYCDQYKRAGTKRITIAEARVLNRESPHYWTKDEGVIMKLLAKGIYA